MGHMGEEGGGIGEEGRAPGDLNATASRGQIQNASTSAQRVVCCASLGTGLGAEGCMIFP